MGVMHICWAALLCLACVATRAETLRLASYDPGLSRNGPGLLLRDIERGNDAQIAAAIAVITHADADILLLTGFEWDHDGVALAAFKRALRDAGLDYPYHFAGRPNSGLATEMDMNGDGRIGRPDDAQGFGRFSGQGGMALLSRVPLGPVIEHTEMLLRNLIDDTLIWRARAVQRLSSTAHWDVAIHHRGTMLHLLTLAGAPPVFDGPEDRNGRRNHDEIAFWARYQPQGPLVAMGKTNLDTADSEGRSQAMAALMSRVQDPRLRSQGAALAAQTGANARHRGDPALGTAEWEADGPGNLRVDYVLPSRDLRVLDVGVVWPAPGNVQAKAAATLPPHRLVWVDVDLYR